MNTLEVRTHRCANKTDTPFLWSVTANASQKISKYKCIFFAASSAGLKVNRKLKEGLGLENEGKDTI